MTYEKMTLRAFTEPVDSAEDKKHEDVQDRKHFRPDYFLVADTETTDDETQRLNFGSYRYLRAKWSDDGRPELYCVKEGLFYADDLEERYPEGFEELKRYSVKYVLGADVTLDMSANWRERLDISRNLDFCSCREFVNGDFYDATYDAKATVVCFNWPFDISRLAIDFGEARDFFAGGFSFPLFDYEDETGARKENSYRPRIAIKNIDSKRALKAFKRSKDPDPEDLIPEGETEIDESYSFTGHFLDLRTLVFALTDKGHTLELACEAFGIDEKKLEIKKHGIINEKYINYNRQDVKLTVKLLEKTLEEYYRHPIDLQPTKAYSGASIGKAYLRAMGITPILKRMPDFPKEILGYAMNAYYGGRAETRIRRVPVPVVHTDFLSMYPTVNTLMKLWDFQIAERIEVLEGDEVTNKVQKLVETITLKDCFDPRRWKEFVGLVQVEPDGEPFPARVRYDANGQSWQIGVNEIQSDIDTPLWYSLPDVVAAKISSGKTPKIWRAIKFRPVGKLKNLIPVKFRGQIEIDPASQDFFKTVIEVRKSLSKRAAIPENERKRLDKSLKLLANSTSYGISAEVVRKELPTGNKEPVHVYRTDGTTFEPEVPAVEELGVFSFPPLAACITGGARLMLALLEQLVLDKGGSFTFCDTDSMAIVATKEGGIVSCPGGPYKTPDGKEAIKALSWKEVDSIGKRFSKLNPYDKKFVKGSILKVEDENYFLSDPSDKKSEVTSERQQLYCYSISAKRYVLYNLDNTGNPILRKESEHGLGHLLNPTDIDSDDRGWIEELWNFIVLCDALGKKAKEPAWLNRPAVSRLSITSPAMIKPFKTYNKGKSYAETVKPFCFMLSAHIAALGHPVEADPNKFHLIAPYNPDPKKWLEMKWLDLYSGKEYKVITGGTYATEDGVVKIKRYGEVLDGYRTHPEAKSLGPDGEICDKQTAGLLGRRQITVRSVTYIGKESNKLEEVQSGLIHNEEEILNEYPDPRNNDFNHLAGPVLKKIPTSVIAKEIGKSERTVKRYRNMHTNPPPHIRSKLTKIAAQHAREHLKANGIKAQKDDFGVIFQYLRHSEIMKSP